VSLDRRQFAAAALGVAVSGSGRAQSVRRPNVILVLTDDQGYGDLSIHGNPYLKTPHTDAIGRQGVQFTQFQVSPVCSPTRSSLLTGRYNYRTGVVDTFLGRSMMYPDEVTVAQLLADKGYRTGIFGKWHLGDNYPMRACDRGFQESVVHRGGGIGQPADPEGNSYFDPILDHNGRQKKYSGYCTDVFFDAALEWVETGGSQPFFSYIAPNAPHAPLTVGDEWSGPFRKMGLPEDVSKVYGMVANIDQNLGKLHKKLQALNIERDTLLIFMTDNGPAGQTNRFNAGMRATKGTVYQGGIRVPFFMKWAGRLQPRKTDRIAAHIDVLPTILDACNIPKPKGLQLDGVSIMPLASGTAKAWPGRTLFTQWHRGDVPEPFRASAVRTQRYKLIDGKELYDMQADPAEARDIAAANPEIVTRLRKEYTDWFDSVSAVRKYVPPRIYLGTPHENPVTLTRQDWRVPPDTQRAVGWWEVDVRRAGNFQVGVRFQPVDAAATVHFELSGVQRTAEVAPGANECLLPAVKLTAGPGQLRTAVSTGAKTEGATYVDVWLL